MNVLDLNGEFASLGALARVERAVEWFGDDIILSSSFGPTAGVLIQMASRVRPGIRVITIQHGYETDRTLELQEWYRSNFEIDLRTYRAPALPLPRNAEELERFKWAVKVDTFSRMLAEERPKAWLSGLMASETPERGGFDFVRDRGALLALHPILDWSEMQAIDYSLANHLPMNEDYYDPCKGEDQKRECGLHVTEFDGSIFS